MMHHYNLKPSTSHQAPHTMSCKEALLIHTPSKIIYLHCTEQQKGALCIKRAPSVMVNKL